MRTRERRFADFPGRIARLAAAAALALFAAAGARAEMWEAPRALAAGRFPTFLSTRDGPVALWQESELRGDVGRAWIRAAYYEGRQWRSARVSETPIEFHGVEPQLYTACLARSGTIAVATVDSGATFDVYLSRDSGRGFSKSGSVAAGGSATAPRIYESAKGGWILFAGRGRIVGSESELAEGSLTIVIDCADSPDGAAWSKLRPFVQDDEGLAMSWYAESAPAGEIDFAVFQTQVAGAGNLSARYAIMWKASADGGKTWTRARRLTDFQDPAGGPNAGPQFWDNQRPTLLPAGSGLRLAWERRMIAATRAQTLVASAAVDSAGGLDPATLATASPQVGSWQLAQFVDLAGSPAIVSLEVKDQGNRVALARLEETRWAIEDLDLSERADSSGAGATSFARVQAFGGRLYAAWQLDQGSRGRIFALEPDAFAAQPYLAAANFPPEGRSRVDEARVRVLPAPDASGIARYAYSWRFDDGSGAPAPGSAELWESGTIRDAGDDALSLGAPEDGRWRLSVSVEDRAGNRSAPARLSFVRDRTPPPPPTIEPPPLDGKGALASNTFTLRWIPPEDDDLAGYTYELAYAGPLASEAAQAALKAAAAVEPAAGLTAYETGLAAAAAAIELQPFVLGTAASLSRTNVDDGYYLLAVAAIDGSGNVSDKATAFLRADKFVPYTTVTLATSERDDLGRTTVRISGRGFLAEGRIERIAIDRDAAEPYDVDRSRAELGYRITGDRTIEGLSFEDAETGSYRIGLFHSKRGWYWTRPVLSIEAAGTVKYVLDVPYRPAWSLVAPRDYRVSAYDLIVLAAAVFAALGIALSAAQIARAAREGEAIRLQAVALVTGGPMPSKEKARRAQKLRKRGAGLRLKFTIIIGLLVIFVVVLVSLPLGLFMIRTQSSTQAAGLERQALVLLESAAQGGRFFLGKEDAVTQLSFLPTQAKAMPAARYITISGNGPDGGRDVVFATNDEAIAGKLRAQALVLSQSSFKVEGPGADPLAPLVEPLAADLDARAAREIAEELGLKDALTREKAALPAGAASDAARSRINAELDELDRRIREKLRLLSDQEVRSLPPYDANALATQAANYLYYKPILEYRQNDKVLFRGMVRLEISTETIVREVGESTVILLRNTLIFAAIALGVGLLGAIILSAIIVVPIRKLVAQIERIRDTEDKEELAGSKIEVASRDELYALADSINQMTDGLVLAAKASKELIVGKGIQKMFIPLDAGPSRAKLSTGRRDERDFEVYGYYEGAKGVSGDYWDFRSINARYHYFIKCDISGKGVSAALIMVEVATMVINYFNEWKKAMPRNIDLTDLAYKINDFIEERGYEGKRFAAFTLGLWDSQSHVAYLCEAGDRKLHVWNARERRLEEELLPDSPAAGIFPSFMVQMKTPFTQVTRKLESGDVLLLYTDGIEEAKRHFRDSSFQVVACTDAEKDQPHLNHTGGQDGEEFGYDRLTAVLEAVDARGSYRLVKHHDPVPDDVLTFDFSGCTGSLEEKVIALIAVEKVFRMYPHPAAGDKDVVLVDEKVDAFLSKHFDQYRLYCSRKRANIDPQNENPGYLQYTGIREDDQYDDLTILGIGRK